MALIIMVVWDTEENNRSTYTRNTITGLLSTVDFDKHRLFISDNGSCEETQHFFSSPIFSKMIEDGKLIIHQNGSNIGTSKALNEGIRIRKDGEHCIKIDGDILIYQTGWVEEMEAVIERDPQYGIVGLKRKDLIQSVNNPNPDFKSNYVELPHDAGQRWLIAEETHDIIGTCTMFNHKLIDTIGYSFQPSLYGFEDNLYSLRSRLSGFKNCFIPHIEIDHLDNGGTLYTKQKIDMANEVWSDYQRIHGEYCNGTRQLYYDGGFSDEN